MEKVVNSVQQILTECKEMIALTEGSEFVDINSLVKTLRDECDILHNYFELSPEDEANINKQKQTVERIAIRLEYYMSVRLNQCTERMKLRKFASTLYNDCRSLTLFLNRSADKQDKDIITWGANTNWALGFYSRSFHIIFSTDEDDEKHIRDIVENMKIVKERYKYA